MADITFRRENGEVFSFSPDQLDGVNRAMVVARSWAALNGFSRVTFIERDGTPLKFHVQIDDEPPLNAWVDGALFDRNRLHELEQFLDWARGEHRRRAAGYEHYDR
jgi:hypothetical protein